MCVCVCGGWSLKLLLPEEISRSACGEKDKRPTEKRQGENEATGGGRGARVKRLVLD